MQQADEVEVAVKADISLMTVPIGEEMLSGTRPVAPAIFAVKL